MPIPLFNTRVCVCVCVCVVSVIVKRPVPPPCVVVGCSRNPLLLLPVFHFAGHSTLTCFSFWSPSQAVVYVPQEIPVSHFCGQVISGDERCVQSAPACLPPPVLWWRGTPGNMQETSTDYSPVSSASPTFCHYSVVGERITGHTYVSNVILWWKKG